MIVGFHERRSPPTSTLFLSVPKRKFIFDLKKQTLQINSKTETLTHREAYLLYYLIKNRNQVLERSFILKKLWGDDDFFNARSMDVFITKLRKKLKIDSAIQIINVRGYGYKLIY